MKKRVTITLDVKDAERLGRYMVRMSHDVAVSIDNARQEIEKDGEYVSSDPSGLISHKADAKWAREYIAKREPTLEYYKRVMLDLVKCGVDITKPMQSKVAKRRKA